MHIEKPRKREEEQHAAKQRGQKFDVDYGEKTRRYEDAADHTAWCETWVWGQRLLDRDAGERGRVEEVCAERAESFPDATCDAYAEVDW